MTNLRLEDVTVRYHGSSGTVTAVDHVSLEIPHGKVVGLVGESGSGKSTLARAILGLAPVQGGHILLNDHDVTRGSHRARRSLGRQIQIVFQDPDTALDPRMTVRQSLLEGVTAFHRLDRRAREDKVTSLLGLVGLDTTLADAFPRQLSGGQRQRIAIARALGVDPSILIADEVTSALDVSVQGLVLNLIRELQTRLGLSMLFIGHNLAAVRYVSDVIAVMYCGQIVEIAPTDQLMHSPQHPYTRSLLASVPSFTETTRTREVLAVGELADPANPPGGCRFHPRCPMGPIQFPDRAVCASHDPQSDALARTHRAACHFASAAVPVSHDEIRTSPVPRPTH